MYVDYILGISDCKTVEKVIRNTRRLEKDNKFRFSILKNQKYMVINRGQGNIEEIKKISERGNHREDR